MLSIKLIGSGANQVNYYASLGTENYYTEGGEPPGEYWGSGSKLIGLEGKVGNKELGNLLAGYSICGKNKLVQNAGSKARRAGFDLTWSVPKSVSVAWSQSDLSKRLLIERAGERAVKRSLQVVAELCGKTRRGRNGERIEDAHLIGAIFRHDTAREVEGGVPDPQLHFHSVMCNVVVREDGTTGALDGRPLFKKSMKMALGALFRTELSRELGKLGLTSHRPKNRFGKEASWFELEAVPKELIKAFSKRRLEIKEWLKKRGLSGAKASELAATKTRKGKRPQKRSSLFEAWKEVGLEHGFEGPQFGPSLAIQSNEETQGKVSEKALASLTEHLSTFSETELLRHLAESAQCSGLSIKDVRAKLSQMISKSPELVRLRNDSSGEKRFTTREMLALEAKMFESVRSMSDSRNHILRGETVAQAISSHSSIRGEQAEAVRHITLGRGSISCVNGMAGTGKTYLLKVARVAFEGDGYKVLGTTLAATASKVLKEGSGIESTHIHSLFGMLERGEIELNKKTVLVLDEAGMVGTRLINEVIERVQKANAKLVLVGDQKQLTAISAGSPFRAIAERIGSVDLQEITRQRDVWARKAVKEFSRGEAESALKRFADRGQLVISDRRVDSLYQLVSDWHKSFCSRKDAAIFASTRLDVSNINRLCQFVRRESGESESGSIELSHEKFFIGDRVMFRKNHRGYMLRNGSTGTVRDVDSQKGEMMVSLDDGYSVRISTKEYDEIELGYAMTTHKGQGRSVDESFILAGGPMTDREMSYVQGSRHREKATIYADIESGGADIEALAQLMNRSRQKDMAHEHLIEIT